MTTWLWTLALLPALAAAAAPAPFPVRTAQARVKVVRSYVTFATRQGEIHYETVCEKELAVPVYDFRAHPEQRALAESAELLCDSSYRDQTVPVSVRGRLELVPADEFGLGLPEGAAVKRTFFTLSIEAGGDFPYLRELQNLTGFQLFTEELRLRTQYFLLSPEAFLRVECGELGCYSKGPQSVFRAQVSLVDSD